MANGCWMAWCLAWNAVQRFIFCWLFFVFFSNELALLFHLVLYIVVLMAWLKPLWWKRTAFHWRSEPMWRWPCTLQLINLADIEPDGTQKFTFFWGLKQSCYAIVWIYIYRIVASTNKKASPEKSCVICVQLPPESLAREDSCIYIYNFVVGCPISPALLLQHVLSTSPYSTATSAEYCLHFTNAQKHINQMGSGCLKLSYLKINQVLIFSFFK